MVSRGNDVWIGRKSHISNIEGAPEGAPDTDWYDESPQEAMAYLHGCFWS